MDDVSHLNDSTVLYRGYLIASRGADDATPDFLLDIRKQCFNVIGHRLANHIWQEEPFVLRVNDVGLPHLEGSTFFGDNIEDEWFIVDLLYHLTEHFPQLAFQVEDSDGDFLLIEAADHLPKWVDPSSSSNRVFVFDGRLHLIPVAQTPAQLTNIPGSATPSLTAALVALRDFSAITCAAAPIQRQINARRHDSRLQRLHHAHCLLPSRVAAVLKADPQLLAPAVQAFYLRDPIDLKALWTMKEFPPEEHPVLRRVAFTRCLFAQVTSQKFVPDRRSPWRHPPSDAEPHRVKAWDLGMRITCGFEMLCNRRGAAKRRNDTKCDDKIFCDKKGSDEEQRRTFFDSLKRNGFFKGELEGSKHWNELLKKAEEFYQDIVLNEGQDTSEFVSRGVKEKIEKIFEKGINLEALREGEKHLPESDCEDWLNLNPQELDDMMAKYQVKKPQEDGKQFDLNSVSQTFHSFVNHVSEFDGVEFPGSRSHPSGTQTEELDSDDEEVAVKNPGKATAKDLRQISTDKDVDHFSTDDFDFDVATFSEALEKMTSEAKSNKKKKNRGSSGIASYNDSSQSEEGDDDQSEDDDNDDDFLLDDSDDSHSQENSAKLQDYMESMDEELTATDVGKTFETKSGDEDEPLDVDFTLVKNILESYATQPGLAGPATNILQSMGIHLPDPETQ